jgi:hypothetical protein
MKSAVYLENLSFHLFTLDYLNLFPPSLSTYFESSFYFFFNGTAQTRGRCEMQRQELLREFHVILIKFTLQAKRSFYLVNG